MPAAPGARYASAADAGRSVAAPRQWRGARPVVRHAAAVAAALVAVLATERAPGVTVGAGSAPAAVWSVAVPAGMSDGCPAYAPRLPGLARRPWRPGRAAPGSAQWRAAPRHPRDQPA